MGARVPAFVLSDQSTTSLLQPFFKHFVWQLHRTRKFLNAVQVTYDYLGMTYTDDFL